MKSKPAKPADKEFSPVRSSDGEEDKKAEKSAKKKWKVKARMKRAKAKQPEAASSEVKDNKENQPLPKIELKKVSPKPWDVAKA